MTSRQADILASIIEQYAEVASPVGSALLAKVFNVSPATIRSEMAELERMGYISQPHTSAGRVPTDKGYRFYVNAVQSQETEVSTNRLDRGSRAIDTRVRHAGEPDQAIRAAVDGLVQLTRNLGLATIGGTLYMSGLTNLFSQPEFLNGSTARSVASLLDNLEPWLREAAPNQPLSVYIGHENPIGKTSGCSLIISKFHSPYSDRSYIGVLGPTRQDYRGAIALVKSAGQSLEQLLS